MQVKDIMSKQSYVLNEDDDICFAAEFMKKERVRNLPIVDKENKLVGLITLREIIDGFIQNSKRELVNPLKKESNYSLVGNIMIRDVKTVGPNTPLKGAIEMMILNKYNIIPIVDNNRKLLGILTEHEIMKKLYELVELPKGFYEPSKAKKRLMDF